MTPKRAAIPAAFAAAAIAAAITVSAQTAAPPKLTPLTADGYQTLLASHRGRVLLVNFWATYCVPCRTEIPEVVRMAAQLRARGLDFALISADEPEQEAAARKFIAGKAPAPLYIKSAGDNDKFAASIYPRWAGELPASFIYDPAGKQVGAFIGEVPIKDLQTFLEKFL